MHYYSFNIKDYRKDTQHLKPMEHYIYRMLIDLYYMDEKPIPKKTQWVMRRLMLDSPEYEIMLNNVLDDFFYECEGGFKHKRIDSEIGLYHANADKNRKNGAKGGRPRKDKPKNNPVGFDSVANGLPSESQINPNQEPLTINQEPRTSVEESANDQEITDEAIAARNNNANSMAAYQAPSRQTMQTELFMAGTPLEMTDSQYGLHVEDYKAHYEQRAIDGHPLQSDSIKKTKLRAWLQNVAKDVPSKEQQDIAARPHSSRSDSFNGDSAPKLTRQQQIEQNKIEMAQAGLSV